MGEVKGGDFASHGRFCRMARRPEPKIYQFAAFSGSKSGKKKNPETSVPGFKKPRNEIQTYFVTFGVKAVSLVSKGL